MSNALYMFAKKRDFWALMSSVSTESDALMHWHQGPSQGLERCGNKWVQTLDSTAYFRPYLTFLPSIPYHLGCFSIQVHMEIIHETPQVLVDLKVKYFKSTNLSFA